MLVIRIQTASVSSEVNWKEKKENVGNSGLCWLELWIMLTFLVLLPWGWGLRQEGEQRWLSRELGLEVGKDEGILQRSQTLVPRIFGFFIFYFCVVHFENMNGNAAATGRLRCGIMNIPVCKLVLGFFLQEAMNSCFSNMVSISLKSF